MIYSASNDYDVAIVGAGPAGSSAAIRLSMAGLRILLVEQTKFPREKLCGEFISPECLTHFAELDVLPAIESAGGTDLTETVFYGRSGKGVTVQSEWFGAASPAALGLSRAEMDECLTDRARADGVDVREETLAIGLLFDKEKVVGLKLRDDLGDETEVSAALTIDATGRARSLAKRLDKDISVKRPAKFVAFKTHLQNVSLPSGVCEIYVYRGGYGGCNRVEKNLYNLCFIALAADTKRVGSVAEKVMREIVFTNRRAAEAMRDANVIKPWRAVAIERFGRRALVPAEGLITIGDSAAFIDPFTGSGMLLALESAKLAASAIVRSYRTNKDFHSLAAEYKTEYGSAFDKRLLVCSLLRNAAFVPFWAEAMISLLSISTHLRRRIARATRSSAAPDA